MVYITECETRAEIWLDDPREVEGLDELPEMVALADVLGDLLANGWTLVQASDLGFLSEAPVLSRDIYLADDGMWKLTAEARLYAFQHYQEQGVIETLARDGMVVFDLATVR